MQEKLSEEQIAQIRREQAERLANGGYDILFMNPPYDRNTHLDFARQAIHTSRKVVEVSPLRWLQDPFHSEKRSTLKQYEDVAEHVESVDDFKNNDTFDIEIYSDLGIYVLDKDKTNFDYKNFWKANRTPEEISIIEKVCKNPNIKHLSDVCEVNKRDGIRVLIASIGGNRGYLPVYKDIKYTIDGKIGDKDWTECKNMGGYEKPKGSPIPISIKFNSIEEAENFYNSYKELKTLKVICDITVQQQNIQLQVLPFLNSYKEKIIDEQLYKLFKFTDKEIEFIENYKK